MIKTARQLKDLIRNLSKKSAADAQILMRNYNGGSQLIQPFIQIVFQFKKININLGQLFSEWDFRIVSRAFKCHQLIQTIRQG